MSEQNKHCTEETADDFARAILIDSELDYFQGNRQSVDLTQLVEEVRARGLKLALFTYDDGDPQNFNGLVYSECFLKLWEALGKPTNGHALEVALKKIDLLNTLESTGCKLVVEERYVRHTYSIDKDSVHCDTVCGG